MIQHTTFSTNIDNSRNLPAILPRAHTACSQTFWLPDSSSFTNFGTAPEFTTAFVCSLVPEAIFVNAQAASN
jgi:hypothetical protein